jgi:hydrogenase maturation protease
MTRPLVLALGNPERGDDGVGQAVLLELSSGEGWDGKVDLIDGGNAGLETALLLEGRQQAVIVDAADMGLRPGSWRPIPVERILGPDSGSIGGLHAAGLRQALQLASALDGLPQSLTVIGVQPEVVGWRRALSQPVQQAVPAVCAAIRERILDPKD